MSRQTEYNLKCPPQIKDRIEIASRSQFYILSQSGPMAFIIGSAALNSTTTSTTDESSQNIGKFKVALGSRHSCSCQKYPKEGNLCLHVLWILVRIFNLSPENPILFQYSLVDREIEELLKMNKQKKKKRVGLKNASAETDVSVPEIEEGQVKARKVESDDDVCAICQEVLISSETSCQALSPLMHCKLSCGNSLHQKCLKILIQHQKSLGQEEVKCPYCRNEFGKIDRIEEEMSLMEEDKKMKMKREHVHYGMECHSCHTYPIKGNIQKCKSCPSLYLCEPCFKKAEHSEHSFFTRNKPHSKWDDAVRAVSPTLPTNIISDFQNRELTDRDYEILLALDSGPQVQGSTPLHIVNSFPIIKLVSEQDKKKVRLDDDGKCKVCAIKIRHGELVRQIPCGHGFHQQCIDRWLIHSRSTCPTCGSAAYSSLGTDETEGDIDVNAAKYISNHQIPKKPKSKKKSIKKEKSKPDTNLISTQFSSMLMITGGSRPIESVSAPNHHPPTSKRNKTSRPIRLPPLNTGSLQLAEAAEDLILVGTSQSTMGTIQTLHRQHQFIKKESSLKGSLTFGKPKRDNIVKAAQSTSIADLILYNSSPR